MVPAAVVVRGAAAVVPERGAIVARVPVARLANATVAPAIAAPAQGADPIASAASG
jgi:hypothetical protein